jgi:hypothetical protein
VPFGSDYTDAGRFPRAAMSHTPGLENIWSFFLLNGSPFFVCAGFVLSGVAALLLGVGWRTSLMTPLGWLLLLSLQARVPHSNDSGDVLLRMILFWGIFLPWGEHWSIDAFSRQGSSQEDLTFDSPSQSSIMPYSVFRWATLAYTLQIVIIYFFSLLWKSNRSWMIDGTAVYYALHLDKWTSESGRAALNLPFIYLRIATHLTILIELSPLLLLLPFWVALAPKFYQLDISKNP